MSNPKAFFALVASLTVFSACTNLTPAQQARQDKFDCQVSALKPVLGVVLDVEPFVRDLYAGKADIGAALRAVGATELEVQQIVKDLRTCAGPAPAALPVGNPS